MSDQNEMNGNNELNEQDLEQTAGGVDLSDVRRMIKEAVDSMAVFYRCPECNAVKKVTRPGGTAPTCGNGHRPVKMVKE